MIKNAVQIGWRFYFTTKPIYLYIIKIVDYGNQLCFSGKNEQR